MNWAMLLMMALAIVTVVAGSVLYGYALAIKHIKAERERQLIQARLRRINTGQTKPVAYDFDAYDIFDVD